MNNQTKVYTFTPMSEIKSFLEEYGNVVGKDEIALVQMIADDLTREQMADRMGLQYKTLAARINKLREDIGVKSDAKLALIFQKNGLID